MASLFREVQKAKRMSYGTSFFSTEQLYKELRSLQQRTCHQQEVHPPVCMVGKLKRQSHLECPPVPSNMPDDQGIVDTLACFFKPDTTEWRCYELKVTRADFYSKAKLLQRRCHQVQYNNNKVPSRFLVLMLFSSSHHGNVFS
jgi:hypothetical protein